MGYVCAVRLSFDVVHLPEHVKRRTLGNDEPKFHFLLACDASTKCNHSFHEASKWRALPATKIEL